MSTVIERPETPVDDLPIDEELITDSVDAVLGMALSTSTREDIDGKTLALFGHLNLLLAEELGADEDPKVKELFHEAYRHLDMKGRPNKETPAFSAFSYMRQTAFLTQRFLKVYEKRSGTGVS
ncbi:hypothetical protein RCO28_12355 [Streptomyces sp. LHD-70]|uniref:hypothetical protein n=1 Tax=Streptomyces sp. LHD-70 TaxID=3072140 RepID=UPI00280D05D2|nr:hypothetical protein [Streptomyces sp. LHD-70]MDQ8703273.1 hypothetical protein [Streptomyces sp. LHD-70]